MYTPYTPLLYSETGVLRGIPIFHFFALKHRVWVFVTNASARRVLRVPTVYVLSKNKKNSSENFQFYNRVSLFGCPLAKLDQLTNPLLRPCLTFMGLIFGGLIQY